MAGKDSGGCIGFCGDLTYEEIKQRFVSCYKGSGLTDNDLARIHNKWKNLGLLAKASRL